MLEKSVEQGKSDIRHLQKDLDENIEKLEHIQGSYNAQKKENLAM